MPENTPKLFIQLNKILDEILKSGDDFTKYLVLLDNIKKAYDANEEARDFTLVRTDEEKMNIAKSSAMRHILDKYLQEDYMDSLISSLGRKLNHLANLDEEHFREGFEEFKKFFAFTKFLAQNKDDRKRFEDGWKDITDRYAFIDEKSKKELDSITVKDFVFDENTIENLVKTKYRDDVKEVTKAINDKFLMVEYFKNINEVNKAIKKAEERREQTEDLCDSLRKQVERIREPNNLRESSIEDMKSQSVYEKYTKHQYEIRRDIRLVVTTAEALRNRRIANESHGRFYNFFFGSLVEKERAAIQRELEKLAEVSERPEVLKNYVNAKDEIEAKQLRTVMMKAESAKLAFYDPKIRQKLVDEMEKNLYAITLQKDLVEARLLEYEKEIDRENKDLIETAKEINEKIDDALLRSVHSNEEPFKSKRSRREETEYLDVKEEDVPKEPLTEEEKFKFMPAELKEKLGIANDDLTFAEFDGGFITSLDGVIMDEPETAKAVGEVFSDGYFTMKGNLFIAGERFIKDTLEAIKKDSKKITKEDFDNYAKQIIGNYCLMETMGLYEHQERGNQELIINRECLKTQEMFIEQVRRFQRSLAEMSKLDYELPKANDKDAHNAELDRWRKAKTQDSVWVRKSGIKSIEEKYNKLEQIKANLKNLNQAREKLYEDYYIDVDKYSEKILKERAEDLIKSEVSKKATEIINRGNIQDHKDDPDKTNKELLDLEKAFVDEGLNTVQIPWDTDGNILHDVRFLKDKPEEGREKVEIDEKQVELDVEECLMREELKWKENNPSYKYDEQWLRDVKNRVPEIPNNPIEDGPVK